MVTQVYETLGARGSPAVTRPGRDLRGYATQVGLVAAAIVAYFTARGLTESDPTRALRHAEAVIAWEQRHHLHDELALQKLVIGHGRIIDVLNWIYIWGHWPVIVAVLVWLLRTHPEPYRLLRNAIFISGAIGIAVFVLYPVAPPRLAGIGLVDTVTTQSHAYRVLQPPAFVNQYAAIPSLHVGWDLLVGIFVFTYARRRVARLFGVITPIAMTTAVVLTANHFVIDAALGAFVALIGLGAALVLRRRSG